jgi:hypothetical protein
MVVRPIVMGVDGSEESLQALEWAAVEWAAMEAKRHSLRLTP